MVRRAPLSRTTTPSWRYSFQVTCSKQRRITVGSVSLAIEAFAWFVCKRSSACRESGACTARSTIARVMRKVLPERAPPARQT